MLLRAALQKVGIAQFREDFFPSGFGYWYLAFRDGSLVAFTAAPRLCCRVCA